MSIRLKYPIRGAINFVAAALSVAALVVLVSRAAQDGLPWHVVSFTIYGVSMVALWTISATYHSFHYSPLTTLILKRFDHAMIYFLIAGTYTPVCLIILRGGWGWSLFGVTWALAIAGITLKLIFRTPPKAITVILFVFYMVMGWLIVIAWVPLRRTLPSGGVFWLVLGGFFYTTGAGILGIKRPDIIGNFGTHEIWHLFVMAGCFCHFWMMYKYVLSL